MIACMVSGRLKEKAKWHLKMPRVTTITTATMIATDAANRATQVLIETTDDDIGRTLRKLDAGAMLTVTGEVALQPTGKVIMRPRRVTLLDALETASVTAA